MYQKSQIQGAEGFSNIVMTNTECWVMHSKSLGTLYVLVQIVLWILIRSILRCVIDISLIQDNKT